LGPGPQTMRHDPGAAVNPHLTRLVFHLSLAEGDQTTADFMESVPGKGGR
jgi:hypothetical protein